MRHEPFQRRATIGDMAAAIALLAPAFVGLAHERLLVAYLDDRLRLLHVRSVRGFSSGRVEVPVRGVIRAALRLGAANLILAHNHPGGDPTPSRADKSVTRRLAEIAHALDIRIVDHLVFAGEACAGFRELGLL